MKKGRRRLDGKDEFSVHLKATCQKEGMHLTLASMEEKDRFSQGFRDGLPTMMGYLSIGLSFGIVGVVSGLSILEIFLIAALVYAGAAQFILCALFIAGTPASGIIFTVFVVNFRHLLMGLTIAPALTRYSVIRNIGFGTLLTDESFGIAITEKMNTDTLHGKWMDGLNVSAYIAWVFACVAGAVVGQWIPNAERFGLDFALLAMFIALVTLQVLAAPRAKWWRYVRLIAVVGLLMYVLLHFLPGHIAVLIATAIAATIGVMTEK